jgi:hypothetical protein
VTWGVAQAASILAFGGDLSLLVDGVDPEADDVDPAVDERIDIVRKAWYAATDEVDRFREHLTEVLGLSVVPSDDELRTRVAQLAGAVRHLAAGLDVPMPDLGALPVSMEALTARLREFRADVVSP